MNEFLIQEEPNKEEPNPVKPVKQVFVLATVGTCLSLGVLGAFFFDGQSWGINIALFSLLLIGSLLLLRTLREQPFARTEYALVATGFFFAATFAWRDSLVLNSLSALGILLTMNLAFTLGTRKELQPLNVSDVFQDFFASSIYGFTSYYDLLTEDVRWNQVRQRWGQFGGAALRGLLITIPLLIGFGILLTTSDVRFEAMISDALDWGWDTEQVIRYLITFIICGWIVAAILRGSVLNKGLVAQTPPHLPRWQLSSIEIVMVLGALNILFLSFIIVQFSYFFGGDALVQSSQGPTYARYAQQGFFQLVAVAFLVMALLLFIHWMYKPSSRLETKLFPVLAAIMVVITMVIEATAAHRMYLYIRVYGLTELRLYTSVFMLWLVVVFLWFSVTVLREQRDRFVFGAISTALFLIGLLHVINPDARIADVNLARLQVGERFEAEYVTSLSADVVPTLLTTLHNLPADQGCTLWKRLQSHPVLNFGEDNWRAWHWSRYHASELLSFASKPQC